MQQVVVEWVVWDRGGQWDGRWFWIEVWLAQAVVVCWCYNPVDFRALKRHP